MKEKALAYWKLLLSFRARDWEFRDYPVVIRKQEVDPALPSDQQHRYWASVVNWWSLTAGGASPREARENLARTFDNVKAHRVSAGRTLPRPGTVAPIEFASTTRIGKNQDLSDDFIARVLNIDWAFISDDSSLFDFTHDKSIAPYFERIKDAYGVDASDIESGNIATILERISTVKS